MDRITLFILILISSTFSFGQSLKVSNNGRFLQTKENKPFFWLGDTAWELFHKLDKEEAKLYLKTRANQGFTIIQAVILAERDGVKTPNANGDLPFHDLDPDKPNEDYFSHVDFIINEANRLGLIVGVLPTWGDKVYSEHPGEGPILFGKEKAARFGEFLGQRYADSDLVWILGGDRLVANEEVAEVWNSMAQGLKNGDEGKHLMSFHPRGYASSSQFFHKSGWLDFNMYQSSHSQRYQVVYEFAEEDRKLIPVKPTLDGEPPYEDIPVKFWEYMKFKPGEFDAQMDENQILMDTSPFEEGFFDGHDVRVHAYWNILSGAAGYTYGNNTIWQMHKKGETPVIPALTDWVEALKRPGAESMRYFRKFFKANDFSELEPAQELILGENPEGKQHIRAALSEDKSVLVAYFANPRAVKFDFGRLKPGTIYSAWYNPRTGKYLKKVKLKDGEMKEFSPPSSTEKEDWAIVFKVR